MKMKIELSEREFHTVLAALRLYQATANGHRATARDDWVMNVATNMGRARGLSDREIDKLVYRLNFGTDDNETGE